MPRGRPLITAIQVTLARLIPMPLLSWLIYQGAELGYKNYVFITYYGVLGPAGLPQPIVTRLNADLNKILQSADVRTAFHAQGLEPDPMKPEAFSALIKADIQKSKDVITAANIKME